MGNSFADPIWFMWPVTFALSAGFPAGRLVRRGAPGSALLPATCVLLAVVPLTFALPVHCGDDDASLDLSPIPLVFGLLGIVAWLAIASRLRVATGEDRAKVERGVLWTAAALVPLGFVELIASAGTWRSTAAKARTPHASPTSPSPAWCSSSAPEPAPRRRASDSATRSGAP